jgi:hypothetical protein
MTPRARLSRAIGHKHGTGCAEAGRGDGGNHGRGVERNRGHRSTGPATGGRQSGSVRPSAPASRPFANQRHRSATMSTIRVSTGARPWAGEGRLQQRVVFNTTKTTYTDRVTVLGLGIGVVP